MSLSSLENRSCVFSPKLYPKLAGYGTASSLISTSSISTPWLLESLSEDYPFSSSAMTLYVLLVNVVSSPNQVTPMVIDSSISEPLELLHIDLYGPSTVASLHDKKYVLVIVDDFTHFT